MFFKARNCQTFHYVFGEMEKHKRKKYVRNIYSKLLDVLLSLKTIFYFIEKNVVWNADKIYDE